MTIARDTQSGFSLAEVLVAMVLLLIGVGGLQAAITLGVRRLTSSQDQVVAAQRAAEAVESVFKARDNKVLTWGQIRNVTGATGADGGVFQDGPLSVRDVGNDGLVNTADDGALAQVIAPGRDGLLGTADDIRTALTGFTREIQIRDVTLTLRQLLVIVRYPVGNGTATYTVTTFISAYA